MTLTKNQVKIIEDLTKHANDMDNPERAVYALTSLVEIRLFAEDIVTAETQFEGLPEDTLTSWAPRVIETGAIGE